MAILIVKTMMKTCIVDSVFICVQMKIKVHIAFCESCVVKYAIPAKLCPSYYADLFFAIKTQYNFSVPN